MFKKPFSFEGRIRRMEYGLSYLGYVAGIVGIVLLGQQNTTLSALLVILFIPLLWFMLAQCAKRCHDRGNSGWWQIIPFYRMWLLFADSDYGDLNAKGAELLSPIEDKPWRMRECGLTGGTVPDDYRPNAWRCHI